MTWYLISNIIPKLLPVLSISFSNSSMFGNNNNRLLLDDCIKKICCQTLKETHTHMQTHMMQSDPPSKLERREACLSSCNKANGPISLVKMIEWTLVTDTYRSEKSHINSWNVIHLTRLIFHIIVLSNDYF